MSQRFPAERYNQIHLSSNKQNPNHRKVAPCNTCLHSWKPLGHGVTPAVLSSARISCDEDQRNKSRLLVMVLNSAHPNGSTGQVLCVHTSSSFHFYIHTHPTLYAFSDLLKSTEWWPKIISKDLKTYTCLKASVLQI